MRLAGVLVALAGGLRVAARTSKSAYENGAGMLQSLCRGDQSPVISVPRMRSFCKCALC